MVDFKSVNLKYGREKGNEVLSVIAKYLIRVFSERYKVTRLNGSSFLAFTTKIKSSIQAINTASKLKNNIQDAIYFKFNISLRVSIGTFFCNKENIYIHDFDEMAAQANRNAYLNLKSTVNINSISTSELCLKEKSELSFFYKVFDVFKGNGFMNYFQPKYNDRKNEVYGYETLLRAKDFHEKFLPESIFPVIKNTELSFDIFFWQLDSILNKVKKNTKKLVYSINVDSYVIMHEKFLKRVGLLLLGAENVNCIEIEILETTKFISISEASKILFKLKSFGFKLSLDDFGNGYSSLLCVKELPIDCIKIDKNFILDVENNARAQAICKSMVFMANELNIDLIAEGVETKKQYLYLKSIGVILFQGFLFGKAIKI